MDKINTVVDLFEAARQLIAERAKVFPEVKSVSLVIDRAGTIRLSATVKICLEDSIS